MANDGEATAVPGSALKDPSTVGPVPLEPEEVASLLAGIEGDQAYYNANRLANEIHRLRHELAVTRLAKRKSDILKSDLEDRVIGMAEEKHQLNLRLEAAEAYVRHLLKGEGYSESVVEQTVLRLYSNLNGATDVPNDRSGSVQESPDGAGRPLGG